MKWFKKKKIPPQSQAQPQSNPHASTTPVQIRDAVQHPFSILNTYAPLQTNEISLYRAIREAVPIVDAAIGKLIRLAGGFQITLPDASNPNSPAAHIQTELNSFLKHVNTGYGQRGLQTFLDCYLDSMIVCGRGIGEIVIDPYTKDISALLCADPAVIQIKEGQTPLDFTFCIQRNNGSIEPLPKPELILFTPFQPEVNAPFGVSLLRSMPFLTNILMKIYQALGNNWERMGNARFAVIYKPDPSENAWASDRASQIAHEWSYAMHQQKNGAVRDFVAVGDVDIKVIGADNQILDSEVPVRQILEQLVAKTGIPPFLLGLSWNSTERMSEQQADMMTSEITALRRMLTPTVERICEVWLHIHGYPQTVSVFWDDINLQDMVEEAKAALYWEQTFDLRQQRNSSNPADPSEPPEPLEPPPDLDPRKE